jgi:branched-chain amino acid transport system substrate-binding protein
MRKRTGLLLTLCGAMGVIGTLNSTRAADLPVITVGLVLPVTSSIKDLAEEVKNAATLYLEQNKAQFKALGFDIRIKIVDDKDDELEGVDKAKSLIADSSVLAALGPLTSDMAINLEDLFVEAKLSLLVPSVTYNSLAEKGQGVIQRLVARNDQIAKTSIDFMADTLQVRNIYIVRDQSGDGRDLCDSMPPILLKNKIKTLGVTSISITEEYDRIIKKLKELKPDAIFYCGKYDVAAAMVVAIRKQNIDTYFIGGDTLGTEGFKTLAGNAAKRIYYFSVSAPPELYNTTADFIKAYRARFNRNPRAFGVLGYDAMHVSMQAINNAIVSNNGKKPTRAMVVTAMQKMNIKNKKTLTGDIVFNKQGDRQNTSIFVMQFGDDLIPRVWSVVPVSKF